VPSPDGRVFLSLLIPLLAFAAYLAYRTTIPQATVVWSAGTTQTSILKRFILPRFDRPFLSFLLMMLVLNFAWIASAIIGVDALVGARRLLAKSRARILEGANAHAVTFLTILGLAVAYALTRFTTYANTRYLLVAFALLPIVMYASLARLGLSPRTRALITGALAAGFAISTVLTADPISRTLYGTFAFGDRSLLRLTRVTHECCGAGRDQLVYNLQFTRFADLTSDATAAFSVDSSTFVFVPPDMLWGALGPLDSLTHRRTLHTAHTIVTHLSEPDSLSTMPAPARAVYLALPNGDVQRGLGRLATDYTIGDPRRMTRGAYWLDVYPLALRGKQAQDDAATAVEPPTNTHERSSNPGR
jgi:hypothetical protein